MNSEGSVSMTIISEGEKELQDEDEGEKDGIGCERKNAIVVNDAGERALRPQGALQKSQGVNIYWERFLHVTSIKVLLVESDDSTRHVVTALLRNCNYEVIEAANVLQAWKVLEELTNHVDLVLIELEMPDVSGMGLLCKIMTHKTRKNLPVIMMSSCHSMSLVVKCLSKGAVDFLVKPIRKNELKNLWQHVWRRCQSSSGSGSETGTQTQDPEYSESIEKCDQSNDADDNITNELIIGDASDDDDDGNNPESSSTNKDVKVDSSQARSLQNEVTKDFQKQSGTKVNLLCEKGKNVVETDTNAGSKFESHTVVSVGKNDAMYESREVATEPYSKRLKESREASHYMFLRPEQSVFTRYNTFSKSNQLDAAAHTVQDKTEETFTTNALQAKALLDPSNSHIHRDSRNIHHFHYQEPEPAMNYERTGKSVTGDDSGCGSGNRMDPNKLAKRRAALTKILQRKKKQKKIVQEQGR